MAGEGLGAVFAMEMAKKRDKQARANYPLAYDVRALEKMAADFDNQVAARTAQAKKIIARAVKREELAGKKGLVGTFRRFAHDLRHKGDYSDKNLLGRVSLFSSSRYSDTPSLATADAGLLYKLRIDDTYTALKQKAKEKNVYMIIGRHDYGRTVDIYVTRNSNGSLKHWARPRVQPALRSTP